MKTRIWIAAAAMCSLFSATEALAQGRRPTPTPTPTTGSPWTDPNTGTTPATTGGVAAMANTAPVSGGDIAYRPEGKSLGIGMGYSSTTLINVGIENVGAPDVVSARFRMDSGLTIEPSVTLAVETGSSKVGTAPADSTTGVDIIFGGNVRKPFWSRNRVEAIFIVGAELAVGSDTAKVGGAKTTSTAFLVGANYGVGVEYFPRAHWSLSLDATNPIINLVSAQSKAGGVKTTTSNIFFGAVFDPTVRLMWHLYY